MEYFRSTETWHTHYPGASAGILVMEGAANPPAHPALEARKAELETRLRAQYGALDRAALRALPTLQAYEAYYRPFKKTYHVQLQLESLAFKGRGIPAVAALVEAMFMAELSNLLLTAGHDLDALRLPVTIDVAGKGTALIYTKLNGEETELKAGDMFMADGEGVISSILSGPDQRTRITPATTRVLFAVYAPPGIASAVVDAHLGEIEENVRVVAPGAGTLLRQVFSAPGA